MYAARSSLTTLAIDSSQRKIKFCAQPALVYLNIFLKGPLLKGGCRAAVSSVILIGRLGAFVEASLFLFLMLFPTPPPPPPFSLSVMWFSSRGGASSFRNRLEYQVYVIIDQRASFVYLISTSIGYGYLYVYGNDCLVCWGGGIQ